MKYKLFILLFFGTLIETGCKKLVQSDVPINDINADNVYRNDGTAASVLTGIYTKMSLDNSVISLGKFTSMSLFPSLSSDELSLFDPNNQTYSGYYTNSILNVSIGNPVDYWSSIYPVVFICNSAIEGLENSATLTPTVKNQLIGEAKFIRAFCYFYLVNYFGNVPLMTTTDWKINATLPRSPEETVYQQIIQDLTDAQALLNESYLKSDASTPYAIGSEERLRPTKWAAAALLARVYLYSNDWWNAEQQADLVINNSLLFNLTGLDSTFLKNSREAIWQLQPVGNGIDANTGEAKLFILPETGPDLARPVYLSNEIVNSFEMGDQRKSIWTGNFAVDSATVYYYPYKYKIGAVDMPTQEHIMVLRLGEQYLIRAEARARQNKISEAQDDLNMIRTRAQLPNTTANDQTSLIEAIQQERKVELFTEWADRWLNMKRTNTIDAIMSGVTPLKGGTWQTTDQLYPIPASEIQKAPQLTQNPGYN